MAENKISVDVELAISKAQQDIDKLSQQFTVFGANASKAVGQVDNAWSVFKGSLAGALVVKALDSAVASIKGLAKAIVTDGIESAKRYEDALNSMNGALAQTGIYSESTSTELEAFANQLEATSRFSDDAALSAMSLIQSLGNLDKNGLKRATQSAADLASALRIDLSTAATLVGKVSAGEIGSLSRYGIKLDETGTAAMRAERGLKALQDRFGGRAAQDLNTFSGATTQMSNAWDDFTKVIGNSITQNPAVIAGVKAITSIFGNFEKEASNSGAAIRGFVKDGLLLAIDTMIVFGQIVDGTIRFAAFLWNGLKAVVSKVMIDMLQPFALFSDVAKDMVAQARESMEQDLTAMGKNMGEEGVIGKLANQVQGIRDQIAAQDVEVAASRQKTANAGIVAIQQEESWHKWFSEQKTKYAKKDVTNTRESLNTIATLQSSKIKELFFIGKAAALAQATINGYEAVSKAFAVGGPLGFILGPLVAVAVGAQIAGIASQQPGFAEGGIVGGSSFTGDRQSIRVNSGEGVITRDQQSKLFDALNGDQLGGGGMTFNFYDTVIDSPARVDELINKFNKQVRLGTPLLSTRLV